MINPITAVINWWRLSNVQKVEYVFTRRWYERMLSGAITQIIGLLCVSISHLGLRYGIRVFLVTPITLAIMPLLIGAFAQNIVLWIIWKHTFRPFLRNSPSTLRATRTLGTRDIFRFAFALLLTFIFYFLISATSIVLSPEVFCNECMGPLHLLDLAKAWLPKLLTWRPDLITVGSPDHRSLLLASIIEAYRYLFICNALVLILILCVKSLKIRRAKMRRGRVS